MFSLEERDHLRDRVLEMAGSDARVVAAAVVGSLALGGGDRWSDVDLTFAVADGVPLDDVLAEWTRSIVEEFDAMHLFDLPVGSIIYRVFLLPRLLQLDISFAPASDFRATSPRFKLLFGKAETSHPEPPSEDELLGWAVLYAKDARVCIERERWWQAEYNISSLRHYALSLACRRRDLPASFGRAFDRLPADVLDSFKGSLVRSEEKEELVRALGVAVAALIRESPPGAGLATRLRGVVSPE